MNSYKLYKINIKFNKININVNKIKIELYQKLINEILESSKVTKSDHFRDPPKTGSGTGIYPGSKNWPILHKFNKTNIEL